MTDLVKVVFWFALSALSVSWNAYVLSTLWGWFVVPVFNAPALGVPYAAGLSLIVNLLTFDYHAAARSYEDATGTATFAFLAPLIALLMGWVVSQFV